MSNAVPINHIRCDDWEAVYVDSKLIEQGHRVNPEKVYKALEWRQIGFYEKIYDEGPIINHFGDRYPSSYIEVMDYLESKE